MESFGSGSASSLRLAAGQKWLRVGDAGLVFHVGLNGGEGEMHLLLLKQGIKRTHQMVWTREVNDQLEHRAPKMEVHVQVKHRWLT